MPLTAYDRLSAFSILFPEPLARVLVKLTWPEIRAGSEAKKGFGPFNRWSQMQRDSLEALCQLVVDFGTPPPSTPKIPAIPFASKCTHPIAQSFHPRVQGLSERAIFILCLNAEQNLDEEVLAVIGGDLDRPPALKALLRHVLIRPHLTFTIVDFRPYVAPAADPATVVAFDRIRDLANIAGVRMNDWFVLGFDTIASAKDELIAKANADRVPETAA